MITKYTIPLEAGNYYHLYNHSNGNDKIFFKEENYGYFLRKYVEYISPVADTFSYCLMSNHFHFLMRIKDENELIAAASHVDMKGLKDLSCQQGNLKKLITKQYANFFNCYAKSINKQEGRIGSLFARPFKRKLINSEQHLLNTVIYIHQNPVNHGFVCNVEMWEHSSFHDLIGTKATFLSRDQVIELFGDKANFIDSHKLTNVTLEEV